MANKEEDLTFLKEKALPRVSQKAEEAKKEVLRTREELKEQMNQLTEEARVKVGKATAAATEQLAKTSTECRAAVEAERDRNASVAADLRGRMDVLDAMHDDMQVNITNQNI